MTFSHSIVGWITARQAVISERTNVTCLLRLKEKEILYKCPRCGDNGVIRGLGTRWLWTVSYGLRRHYSVL
jgi:predicted RNA-binding Zn-ribbon protein involved in translation (DUF1610 family)